MELWGPPGYVRKGLEEQNRRVRGLVERRAAPLLDQEELMGKDLRWYGDVCYLSGEGTERFLQNIAERFARENRLGK